MEAAYGTNASSPYGTNVRRPPSFKRTSQTGLKEP
jgi:hypothetical protein